MSPRWRYRLRRVPNGNHGSPRILGAHVEGPFLSAARDNLGRSQRVQHKYGYKERRGELHTNPFGRLGSGEGTSTWEVTPTPDGAANLRRLIEREGKMIIWITDDARRLPVRSQVHSPYGKIEIKLKSAKNLK